MKQGSKKSGSALVIVLVLMVALLGIGTSISVAVVNTTKMNAKYSDNVDLELAAKSGLNIAIEDFLYKATTEEELNNYFVNNVSEIELNKYLVENQNIKDIYVAESGIEVSVIIEYDKVNEPNKLTFESQAKSISNPSNIKSEIKVVNITIDGGGEVTPEEDLGFRKFVNVKGSVFTGIYPNDIESKMDFSGQLVVNNYNGVLPENYPELEKSQFVVNSANTEVFKNECNVEEFIQYTESIPDVNESGFEEYQYPHFQYGNSTETITDKNLVTNEIRGYNGLLTLTLNNTNLIVRGDIYDWQYIKIVLNGNSTLTVGGKIITQNGGQLFIEENDSILRVNQGLISVGNMEIKLNNSKLLVENKIESTNGTITANGNGGYINVKDYIRSQGNMNISFDNVKFNVNGKNEKNNSIESTYGSDLQIDIKNNSILDLSYGLFSNNTLRVSLEGDSKAIVRNEDINAGNIKFRLGSDNSTGNDNSVVRVNESIWSKTTSEYKLNGNNGMYVGKNLSSQGNEIYITLKNNSIFRVADSLSGNVNAQSYIYINLTNSNMAVNNLSCPKSNINIVLKENSTLIQGGIEANSVNIKPVKDSVLIVNGDITAHTHNVEMEFEESVIFVDGMISSNTYAATFRNSFLICNGPMENAIKHAGNDKISSIRFENRDKGLVFIDGDLKANSLEVHSNNNTMPDADIIDKLLKYISFNTLP